jgi:hypothetical protein
MKKKIGIITLNGYKNFGNRLQNYALQETLKNLGFDVETVRTYENESLKRKAYKMLMFLKIIGKINPKYRESQKLDNLRTNRFKIFSETRISETSQIINNAALSSIADDYDYFVVGSDQVWNPSYIRNNSTFFLTFASKQKRIAYAPSFGTEIIPEQLKTRYSEWLKGINCLSVREYAGRQIIQELTGLEVPVLIDPTLLIDKEKWLSISKSAKYKPSGKFLLIYFLGDAYNNHYENIKRIAEKYQLTIINLADMNDSMRFDTDPSEFIDYINNATIFLTDSFHGAIFSILLSKPFITFDRVSNLPSMNSRIDTLLSKFKLENRKWSNINGSSDILNIDFSHVSTILEKERNKAINYLKTALSIKEE